MRAANSWKSWVQAGAVLLMLAACSSSSSGPKGDGADDAGGDTSGTDTSQTGDTAVAETGGGDDTGQPDLGADAAQLAGSYDLVSVTLEEGTLTTENQDIGGGAMGRIGGTLEIEATGRYTVDFTIYINDSPEDNVVESGDWTLPSAGRIRLEPDDDDPVEANYTYESGTGRLTMEFDDSTGRGTFVFVKQG